MIFQHVIYSNLGRSKKLKSGTFSQVFYSPYRLFVCLVVLLAYFIRFIVIILQIVILLVQLRIILAIFNIDLKYSHLDVFDE